VFFIDENAYLRLFLVKSLIDNNRKLLYDPPVIEIVDVKTEGLVCAALVALVSCERQPAEMNVAPVSFDLQAAYTAPISSTGPRSRG
jgi:hypothetical protein